MSKKTALFFIGILFFTTQTAFAISDSIGFTTKVGGSQQQRQVQEGILANAEDLAAKQQALLEQMNKSNNLLEKISVTLQNIQRSLDNQTLTSSKQSEVGVQQRDLLSNVVRSLELQQQLNTQLLQENRNMRQALETKR